MICANNVFVPKTNESLVRQTMQAIADDLEAWNQAHYVRDNEDGKRQFCFGGRALVIQGYTIDAFGVFVDTSGTVVGNPMEEVMAEMGLTEKQATQIICWIPAYAPDLCNLSKEEQFQAFAEFVLTQTGIDCR